jgi:hypothetical protein
MSNNWWAQKLGSQPQQPATPQPQYVAPQPAQYAQPQQPTYPPSQQTQAQAARCPGCGSGNYGGATPESRPRCYDCGYPIQQSGSGVGTGIVGQGGQSSWPATPATQVPTGGFNPTTIIGHI